MLFESNNEPSLLGFHCLLSGLWISIQHSFGEIYFEILQFFAHYIAVTGSKTSALFKNLKIRSVLSMAFSFTFLYTVKQSVDFTVKYLATSSQSISRYFLVEHF